MKSTNYSYVGIAFIVLVFGIIFIPRIIDRIQDSNINFLFGSGMSAGYLGILGNIEQLLTDLDKNEDIKKEKKNFIRASKDC